MQARLNETRPWLVYILPAALSPADCSGSSWYFDARNNAMESGRPTPTYRLIADGYKVDSNRLHNATPSG